MHEATTDQMRSVPQPPSSHDVPFACSPTIAKVMGALAKAQAAFPAVEKSKTAQIPTKAGGKYEYSYADLASVFEAIRKALADNGLCVFQPVRLAGPTVCIRTVLGHESGEYLSSDELPMPIGDKSDARSVASAITYGRRYSVLSMLGIAPTDEDDDGEAAAASRQRGQQQARRQREPEATGGAAPTDDRLITAEQVKRLKGVMKEHGVNPTTFGGYLRESYNYEKPTDIERKNYDAIIQLAQAGGAADPAEVERQAK